MHTVAAFSQILYQLFAQFSFQIHGIFLSFIQTPLNSLLMMCQFRNPGIYFDTKTRIEAIIWSRYI